MYHLFSSVYTFYQSKHFNIYTKSIRCSSHHIIANPYLIKPITSPQGIIDVTSVNPCLYILRKWTQTKPRICFLHPGGIYDTLNLLLNPDQVQSEPRADTAGTSKANESSSTRAPSSYSTAKLNLWPFFASYIKSYDRSPLHLTNYINFIFNQFVYLFECHGLELK